MKKEKSKSDMAKKSPHTQKSKKDCFDFPLFPPPPSFFLSMENLPLSHRSEGGKDRQTDREGCPKGEREASFLPSFFIIRLTSPPPFIPGSFSLLMGPKLPTDRAPTFFWGGGGKKGAKGRREEKRGKIVVRLFLDLGEEKTGEKKKAVTHLERGNARQR